MTRNQHFTPDSPLSTAVLFLVFNRIEPTRQVFNAIKRAKPPRLYIAADGARAENANDLNKVKAVREYITSNIDWDCEVQTLCREENLGCKLAISGAIDWFFAQEEMGIILEDDCLPSQSFFRYCEELLKKYQDDQRVFLISGYNKQNTWKEDSMDYFFSNCGGIWGWASWRRSWAHFDLEMKHFSDFSDLGGFENLLGKKEGKIRRSLINNVNKQHINTWDYQWAFARHMNGALACVPSKSLIKNIGFGADSTHTFNIEDDGVENHELIAPLRNNPFYIPDRDYDALFLAKKPFLIRVINKLRKILSKK